MFLSLKPNRPEASKPGPRREVASPSDGCVFLESLAWVQVGDRSPLLLPPGQGQCPQSDPWEQVRAGLVGRDQAEKPPAQVVAAPLMLQTQGPVNLHLCTCGHGASEHSYGGLPYETRGFPEAGGRGRTATLQPEHVQVLHKSMVKSTMWNWVHIHGGTMWPRRAGATGTLLSLSLETGPQAMPWLDLRTALQMASQIWGPSSQPASPQKQ